MFADRVLTAYPVSTMPVSSAHVLRERADALRVLARRLEAVSLPQLARRCGTDTWVGPSQQHWEDELRRCVSDLRRAADATRAAARRLEHQAEQVQALGAADPRGVR